MRRKIPLEIWKQIETAYAAGIGLRDPNKARENAKRAFELAAPDDYDGAVEQWGDLQCAEATHQLAVMILNDRPGETQGLKNQKRKSLDELIAVVKERVRAQQPTLAVAAKQGQ
jgi:hypothetical protein